MAAANTEQEFFGFLKIDRIQKDINLINLNRTLKNIQKREKLYQFTDTPDDTEPRGLIRIEENDLKSLALILERDTKFLASCKLMDYSLYLVIEHLKEPLPY